MSGVLQFGGKTRSPGARLDPALREFLDTIVIPALVKEYVREYERENRLALAPQSVKHFTSEDLASSKRVL
jgi:hypothetical protein